MALPAPTYDLMLLLDPQAEDTQHEKVLADVQRLIGGGGEVIQEHDFGARNMAYEVRHQRDAHYHLVQFQGPREVIESLDRQLHIADGVVRYRIIKLPPGAPAPTPLGTAAPSAPLPDER